MEMSYIWSLFLNSNSKFFRGNEERLSLWHGNWATLLKMSLNAIQYLLATPPEDTF
jgi:hypothetical protein